MENSVDDGMPDINASFLIDYWVELKVCDNETKIREVTKLLRDSQIVWNIRRGKHGALIFVVVRYRAFIVLYRWQPEKFNGKLIDIPNGYTQISVLRKERGFDWESFRNVFIEQVRERITYGLCDPRTTR